jgi:hypothetical protein
MLLALSEPKNETWGAEKYMPMLLKIQRSSEGAQGLYISKENFETNLDHLTFIKQCTLK